MKIYSSYLWELIKIEKTTLIKGFLLCAVFILPFTFLPIIGDDGPLSTRIVNRIPWAIFYTTGFSILVIMAALAENYDNLVVKLKLFNSPAFQTLNFKPSLKGKGSLVNELNLFLTGEFKGSLYHLELFIDREKPSKVLIIQNLTKGDLRKVKIEEINLNDNLGLTKFLNPLFN